MNNTSDDQKIFKLILASVASENLTAGDYHIALSSLRNGPMTKVLDQIFSALAATTNLPDEGEQQQVVERRSVRSQPSGHMKSSDALFNDLKRRKITRDRLEAILNSIDNQFLSDSLRSETMRNIVSIFQKQASPRQWELLTSIINGDYEIDPYFNRSE